MIPVPGFHGQAVGVLGLGRSGLAAARALAAGGARAIVWDDSAGRRAQAEGEGFAAIDLASDACPDLAGLIVSPGIPHLYPKPHPAIQRAWERGVPVDNEVGLFFSAIEGMGVHVVAVTGTNGKSTTTALIGHLAAQAGLSVQVGGNIGRAALDLDPPAPGSVVVLELSSYQSDLARRLAPEIALFLNLTPDHLERHGGLGGYFAAKARLFEQGRPRVSIIGADEPEGRFLANRLRAGREPGEGVVAISAAQALGGRGLSVTAQGGMIREIRDGRTVASVSLEDAQALRGEHNWQNAAAAFAALRALGVATDRIAAGLASFPGLEHRMQQVARAGKVLFVNDSKATNADAAARALASFDTIYWIAGGQAKAGGITALQPFFGRIKKAYLIGEAAQDFAKTLDGNVPFTISGDLGSAVAAAAGDAALDTAGEPVVLLSPACASFDQFADFEARGRAFCQAAEKIAGNKD